MLDKNKLIMHYILRHFSIILWCRVYEKYFIGKFFKIVFVFEILSNGLKIKWENAKQFFLRSWNRVNHYFLKQCSNKCITYFTVPTNSVQPVKIWQVSHSHHLPRQQRRVTVTKSFLHLFQNISLLITFMCVRFVFYTH